MLLNIPNNDFIEKQWNLWLTSGDKSIYDWLQNVKEISNSLFVTLDNELEQGIGIDSNCLGMIYKPTNDDSGGQLRNSTITLTSSTCISKKSVACKLDNAEDLKSTPIPFPCIPQSSTARKKRESENHGITDSNRGNRWIAKYKSIIQF